MTRIYAWRDEKDYEMLHFGVKIAIDNNTLTNLDSYCWEFALEEIEANTTFGKGIREAIHNAHPKPAAFDLTMTPVNEVDRSKDKAKL